MPKPIRIAAGVLAALLSARGSTAQRAPGYGPQSPVRAGPWSEASTVPVAEVTPAPKAFAVATRRVDLAQPGRQNWEPSLAVIGSGASGSDGDQVALLWMTGLARADDLTTTGLSSARSNDGFRTHLAEDVANPSPLAGIPFDPMVIADRAEGPGRPRGQRLRRPQPRVHLPDAGRVSGRGGVSD